jgi:hypothetical protein
MRFTTIFLFLCMLIGRESAAQNGWLRPKGGLWTQLSFQKWTSDEFHNLQGQKLTTQPFTTSEMSLFAEYGLSKTITGLINFPLRKSSEFLNTESGTGIGDLRVEFKFKPFKRPFPFALQMGAELPTGKSEIKAYNDDKQLGFINLPTGDGELNFWTHAIASRSFSEKVFGSIYTGYNLRTKYKNQPFNDQLKAGLEIGYSPYSDAWLILKYNALYVLGQSSANTEFIRMSGTTFSQYSVLFLTTVYKRFGVSVQMSGFTNKPSELRNVYAGEYLTFGLVYEIKK